MVRLLHKQISDLAGLDHIRFTDLRHTFAVQALKMGMDIKRLSAVLGHSRPWVTRKDYEVYLPVKGAKTDTGTVWTLPDRRASLN